MSTDRAQAVKDEGNQHFKTGNYQQAISMYSRAIGMTPEAAPLYG
jgi:tetratricopeptide (TPR) repeat protein